MRTTADEKRDEAEEHVESAIKCLSAIFIDRCDGHSDYRSDYRKKLEDTFFALMMIREDFNP